jgi:hypothetical protein
VVFANGLVNGFQDHPQTGFKFFAGGGHRGVPQRE